MSDPVAHDLSALREEYAAGGLAESDLAPDPTSMFARWFDEVVASGLHEPNAMVLATSDDGAPSVRTVLLKGFDTDGFRFFTNLASRKGRELDDDGRCALLFPWHALERQVRVEGLAEELPRADVEAYFATRPRGSRLGAWASHQSSEVSGREELAASYAAATERFGAEESDGEVPVPDEWGGYLVRPDVVEFWQGRPSRMHDRLVYRRAPADAGAEAGAGWTTHRLAP